MVTEAAEPVSIATQAAVPQQQPLTGAWPRARRHRRRGARRSPGLLRRHRAGQEARRSRSVTVPRGAAATSQHPGPEKGGGKEGEGERERERERAEGRREQEVTRLRRKQNADNSESE